MDRECESPAKDHTLSRQPEGPPLTAAQPLSPTDDVHDREVDSDDSASEFTFS